MDTIAITQFILSFCCVTQCPCPVMFRHPGSRKLLWKNTSPLSVGGRKHLRDKDSSCKGLSVHNRRMLAQLEFMFHLQVHIQNYNSTISVLIFKEHFCTLLIHRTSASVYHQRYVHSLGTQDYCCWTCHSSRSFSQCTGKWRLFIWISTPPSQDTKADWQGTVRIVPVMLQLGLCQRA